MRKTFLWGLVALLLLLSTLTIGTIGAVSAHNAAPDTHHYHIYVDESKHAVVTEDEGTSTLLGNCTNDQVNPGVNCGVVNNPSTVDFLVEVYNVIPNGVYDMQTDLSDRCDGVAFYGAGVSAPASETGDTARDDVQMNYHGNAVIHVHAQNCVPNFTGINGSSSDSKYYVNIVSDARDGTSFRVNFQIKE
jgi:hypothetical protein